MNRAYNSITQDRNIRKSFQMRVLISAKQVNNEQNVTLKLIG